MPESEWLVVESTHDPISWIGTPGTRLRQNSPCASVGKTRAQYRFWRDWLSAPTAATPWRIAETKAPFPVQPVRVILLVRLYQLLPFEKRKKVGILLSGGLDSGLVACLAAPELKKRKAI